MSVLKTLALSVAGVLVIGLSGVGVNAAFGHAVTLVVDGQSQVLKVAYGSVAELLASQRIELQPRDRVTPDQAELVQDKMVVEVEYARPIDLTLNGLKGVYWTYGTSVGEVLASLGLGESPLKLSHPTSTPVPRDGLSLTVETGYDVTVTAGGSTQAIHAFGTVADALVDLGYTPDADDLIDPAPTTKLSDGLAISYVKVDQQTITRDIAIPFTTENSKDPTATRGQVTIVTQGADGLKRQTVVQVLHDGTVVSEQVTAEEIVSEPVTQVQKTGTKEPIVNIDTTPGSAQDIAHSMVLARGWDDSEFQCLVYLWNHESGWRVNASNPYSGAYGIPQALPGSKMATAGADWQTNPATQITWGLGYIQGRYGTPCGAWGHFQSNGWY